MKKASDYAAKRRKTILKNMLTFASRNWDKLCISAGFESLEDYRQTLEDMTYPELAAEYSNQKSYVSFMRE